MRKSAVPLTPSQLDVLRAARDGRLFRATHPWPSATGAHERTYVSNGEFPRRQWVQPRTIAKFVDLGLVELGDAAAATSRWLLTEAGRAVLTDLRGGTSVGGRPTGRGGRSQR